jgi:DNA polymerase III delta subunit
VFQREQEMWEMTGELARGNVAAAVRRWRQLVQLDASTEYRAVAWLTMWLQDVSAVLAARSGRSPMPNIAWRYRDRWAQFQHDAQAMGESGVARALDLLTETDRRSKSGIGDAASNVERFLLTVRR